MLRKVATSLLPVLLLCFLAVPDARAAAALDPSLAARLAGLPDAADVGLVIVAFATDGALAESHLNVLRGLGLTRGFTLPSLAMVAVPATAGQVRALSAAPGVRSVWANEKLTTFMEEARVVTGVDRVRTDAAMTRANRGLPFTGAGDFSVVINDSGIDATHTDLRLGQKVVQNVFIPTDSQTLAGFTPLTAVENVPNTDTVGHGTHCAGILGGTGAMSGGRYEGVAPGARIIGCGSGAVLFVLNALGGFEWSLTHQAQYKIRVISNSFGTNGPFDPNNPINIATKKAHDRNIVVVFAAGNSGPGRDTHNPYAKAPWVISVAAGTKEGGLATFSSRGTPRETRLGNDDPNDDYDAPTITAPGEGREFETNAGKFTTAIVSVRAATNVFTNGLTDDLELDPGMVPFYTQIVGTSMATPFVCGVVALMLEADPTLSADDVKQILVQTASRMPGYADYEVGAGYVNAYAAVDKVLNRQKTYGIVTDPSFTMQYTASGPAPQAFHVDYSPAGLPGPGSANSVNFTVEPGMNVLDVFATADTALEDGEGNTIGIVLAAPNGATYSSGIALPILDSLNREIVVKDPVPGLWRLEVRGVRGLAAAPNASLPTSGAAAPGPVDGTITQQRFTIAEIADIQSHALKSDIESALKARLIDTRPDGTFGPDAAVTRGEFARSLWLNTPLRQTEPAAPTVADVTGDLLGIVQSVTAKGSTTRDYDFAPTGMMSLSGRNFNPAGTVSRLDLAVAWVKALGHDADARARANTVVTFNGVPVSDNAQIPGALRGYVQIALDLGLLEAYPAQVIQVAPGVYQALPGPRVEPGTTVTRAVLASKLLRFRDAFVAGK